MTDQSKAELSFKYVKTNCGEVRIKGLGFESIPDSILNVMDNYGFIYDSSDEKEVLFVDCMEPVGDDFYEEFCSISHLVPVNIITCRTVTKKRIKTEYCVQFGVVQATKANLFDAFGQAYRRWHKAGRIIDDVRFMDALREVIQKVNQERPTEESVSA